MTTTSIPFDAENIAREISNKICEAFADVKEEYPYPKWDKKYGKKCLDDVIAEIVAQSLSSSFQKGREVENEECAKVAGEKYIDGSQGCVSGCDCTCATEIATAIRNRRAKEEG